MKFYKQIFIYLFILLVCPSLATSQSNPSAMKSDQQQVDKWNLFARQLYALHKYQLKNREVVINKRPGGYASNPGFFTEYRYLDQNSGKLLSLVQFEKNKPDNIHHIEVYVYDNHDNLLMDYSASYLASHRNAPIQTLINFHFKDDELSAYRQFDASGVRIYEQCQGKYFGKEFFISLEEYEIPANGGSLSADISQEKYLSCFNHLPVSAGKYTTPQILVKESRPQHLKLSDYESIDYKIEQLSGEINAHHGDAPLYIERAKLYFELHQFNEAISDLNQAIKLDDKQDEAYFWRGMSLARNGEIKEGIASLDVYIQRNPNNSRAYTKRGVRYIWLGDLEKAEHDLDRAIKLDKNNAEAHDDIGVIFAQRGQIKKAIRHFTSTVSIDPSYQKGWHNLATASYVSRNYTDALQQVERALQLSPQSKNSLLLKGEILTALGRKKQAREIIEQAEFLPDGNWSEQFPLK